MIVMLDDASSGPAPWRGFLDRLLAATGCDGFRQAWEPGTAADLPNAGLDSVSRGLAATGFQRGILVGRGAGAAIATGYAGSIQDHRIRGLALIEPTFFGRGPDLREVIGYIRVPILIVDGAPEQIAAVEEEAYCPVEAARADGSVDRAVAAVATFVATIVASLGEARHGR